LEDIEQLNCFVLLPALFASYFPDEIMLFEIINNLVDGPA
jgi:hypothetical protein